jgi:hypothetical protein
MNQDEQHIEEPTIQFENVEVIASSLQDQNNTQHTDFITYFK